jgi:hypothetical protein
MFLRVAKTPEEFTEMYRACNSCMDITPRNCTKEAWRMYNRTGLWLSSAYAYMPGVIGYFVEDDGRLMARAIVVGNKFNSLYADNDESQVYLLRQLYALGHKYEPGLLGHFEDFEMPAVRLPTAGQMDYYCFIPKYDFRAFFVISFDVVRKKFKWTQKLPGKPCYILFDGHIPDGAVSADYIAAREREWTLRF